MAIAGEAENKHIVIPGLGKKYPRKSLSHSSQDFVNFHCNLFCYGKILERRNRVVDKYVEEYS